LKIIKEVLKYSPGFIPCSLPGEKVRKDEGEMQDMGQIPVLRQGISVKNTRLKHEYITR
jgi:hypothetical protein